VKKSRPDHPAQRSDGSPEARPPNRRPGDTTEMGGRGCAPRRRGEPVDESSTWTSAGTVR